MEPTLANSATTYPRTEASSLPFRLVILGMLALLLAAIVISAVVQRPAIGTAAAGVAVTDGWAHSPITRLGGLQAAAGVAVTDGWAHSPITRDGSTDGRAAQLRALAASYEASGPAAEARSR